MSGKLLLHFLETPHNYEADLSENEEIHAGRSEKREVNLTKYFEVSGKVMRTISGHHFKIFRERGSFLIQDMSSTNGTKVNGKEVSSAHPMRLRDEDLIMLAENEQFQIMLNIDEEDVEGGDGTLPVSKTSETGSGFFYDKANSRFIIDGTIISELDLPDTGCDILKHLDANRGRVCKYHEIASKFNIAEGTVIQSIKKLRAILNKKSTNCGKKYIKNRRGVGYYLYLNV